MPIFFWSSKLKKINILAISLTALLTGCGTQSIMQSLTGETSVPLELKGYRIGQELQECPNSLPPRKQGRVTTCLLGEDTLGGTRVNSSGITLLDGRIALMQFSLSRANGFSQTGLLRALSEKFGPPAQGSQGKIHIWSNGDTRMQLDELKGDLVLFSVKNLSEAQNTMGKSNASDL